MLDEPGLAHISVFICQSWFNPQILCVFGSLTINMGKQIYAWNLEPIQEKKE